MKKTVLTYGLISGVIAAVLMLAHVPFMDGGSRSLIVGYTGIVLASLLIAFGVRSYRENVGNGKISFGRAFAVGILIALISTRRSCTRCFPGSTGSSPSRFRATALTSARLWSACTRNFRSGKSSSSTTS